MMKRRTTLFSGRVQGVGFRWTTCHVAERFDVTGYVRNCPDGRVELVCEGAEEEIERFQAAVERDLMGFISETQVATNVATGEFTRFEVRH